MVRAVPPRAVIARFHQRLVAVIHGHPITRVGDDALGGFLRLLHPRVFHGVRDDRYAVHPGVGAHVLEVIDVVGEHRPRLCFLHRRVQRFHHLRELFVRTHVLGGRQGNPAAVAVTRVHHEHAPLEVRDGELREVWTTPKFVFMLERVRRLPGFKASRPEVKGETQTRVFHAVDRFVPAARKDA